MTLAVVAVQTAFAVVFSIFVVATLVLIVLVLRFTFQRARVARQRWLDGQSRSEDDAEGLLDGDEERPMTALVLAGGGTRGAVQIGMLQVLAEHGYRPDRIFGTSVGAVNGAGFAGDPTPKGVERMARIWTGLSQKDVFPQGRLHGPWLYFQQRDAVYSNRGLRKIIEDGVSFERLEESVIPFETVATSLVDGREHWFTHGPAVECILASAALPAIFPPVDVDGENYMDGGVVNNVPIRRAIDAGAKQIVVLMCSPPVFEPSRARRPIESVLNALFIAVHARFARDMARLPSDVEVILCTAGEPDGGRGFGDFSSTPELIAEGRREAAEVIRRYGFERLGLMAPTVEPASPSAESEGDAERDFGPTTEPNLAPSVTASPGDTAAAAPSSSANPTDDEPHPEASPRSAAAVLSAGRRVLVSSRRRLPGRKSNGRSRPAPTVPSSPTDGTPTDAPLPNGTSAPAPPSVPEPVAEGLGSSTHPDPGT